jgi:3D (Asp-Asp-Asp) domain-containing protein/peptidoglycan hydrolase CwlO-like protein
VRKIRRKIARFSAVRGGKVWYGRAALRGRSHRLIRAVLVALAGILLITGLPATGPAQSPGVTGLRARGADLARRSQAVVVELYALGSRLEQARADLARLDSRAAALSRRQASARREYRAALETVANAQLQLGGQLRLLYEQDTPDTIAVILGASSLQEAIDGLDNIKRIAHATESVLDQARTARRRVQKERRELAAQVARTKAARARVAAGAADLEHAQSQRSAYLTRLRQEQALNNAQIANLEAQARQAQARAQQVTVQAQQQHARQAPSSSSSSAAASAPAAPEETTTFETPSTAAPGEPPPAPVESVSQSASTAAAAAPGPPGPGGSMIVTVTGYCLEGTTATGLPVGPGIVAVDPSVIPLGTRMTIPGYGEGVAADTGSGVTGARIDVWMASCQDAASFARTATITFL